MGRTVAAMAPWAEMAYPADALVAFLRDDAPGCRKYALRVGRSLAGGVVVHHPWLKGPYLQFLAVLPDFQGQGLGGRVLAWMEDEVRGRERNLWVVCSSHNPRALAFYARHGFRAAGIFPDLVRTGFEDVLLRKFLGDL